MARPDVRAEPLDAPAARELLSELDDDLARRYGSDESVEADAEQFLPPGGLFLVARADGVPLACGGFRGIGDGIAELKRMYVRPAARRMGLARLLVARLEAEAARAGYRQLWLETGVEQPEAIALYTAVGYQPIPPFGQFAWAENQRCYGKDLVANPSTRAPLS